MTKMSRDDAVIGRDLGLYQRYQAVVFRAHFAGHLLECGGCLGEAGQNSTMHVVAKTNAENRGNGQGNPLNKGILGGPSA